MSATEGKEHVSIVICGHVDSGKSTTTGRLIFELGGLEPRVLEKLKAEADSIGKSSFCFAFFMDTQKEERARGITISCQTKKFYTDKWHYTIIDAPGHRDFIKNMITGASQADVCMLMVPADGNFTDAIAKGNHKAQEVQGQTRQHARLIFLLGVKQLIVAVNKMDSDMALYKKERYDEVANEMRNMLERVGWKKDFVAGSVPIVPISGWKGDNLIAESTNMDWWKGVDVTNLDGKKVHVHTLLDALNEMVCVPKRDLGAPVRMPVSGVMNIKGVGSVITGRIEQGTLRKDDEVVFIPSHTSTNTCAGKVFSMEMHHTKMDSAKPGDNIGANVKGLDKCVVMPKAGDVMILKKDSTLKQAKTFTCSVQILDIPGEIKPGYTPIAYVRTGRSACKLTKINWKMGKSTGNAKVEDPISLVTGDKAECVFEPMQPLVVDSFKACEGLSRVAMMEGNTVVMLARCMSTEAKQ